MRRTFVILAAVVAAAVAAPVHPGERQDCIQSCRETFWDDVGTFCAEDDEAKDRRESCVDLASEAREGCIGTCGGAAVGGRCTVLLECIDGCRKTWAKAYGRCWNDYKRRLATSCVKARKADDDPKPRRACRLCFKSERSAYWDCRKECRAAPSSSRSVTTTAVSRERSGCQQGCIEGIVHDCYGECADRCDGDAAALGYCRQACENASCSALKGKCTPEGGNAAAYAQCCATYGSCDGDVSGEELCVTTTTRQSTTTTTGSSSTVSTSTTRFTTTTTNF